MTDATREHYRRKAITCLELTKGFTPEQRNAMLSGHNNCINTIDELSYAIMELTAEQIAEKAGYNQALVDLKKEIQAKIAHCQEAYEADDFSLIRQGQLTDEMSSGEILALKKGFSETLYIIQQLEALKTEIKK